jgi:hypothetical protein
MSWFLYLSSKFLTVNRPPPPPRALEEILVQYPKFLVSNQWFDVRIANSNDSFVTLLDFIFFSEFPAFTAGTRKPGGKDRGIKLCVNSICRNGKIGF